MRPLWMNAPDLPPSPEGNIGLRFTKHFNGWTNEAGNWKLEEAAVGKWLAGVREHLTAPVLHRGENLVERRDGLVRHLGGESWTMTTQSRLIIGAGNPHPLDNGLTWHPVLGVPYIPASGLKGLAKWYAREAAEPPGDEAERARIFGDAEEREGGARQADEDGTPAAARRGAGSVLFFDALPCHPGPPMLDWDVMTPHYGEWYAAADPATTVPGDWYDPVPIGFLTVAANIGFSFAIAPRPGWADQEQAGGDAAKAKAWLTGALQEFGAGAKTAIGYGLMK